MTRQLPTGVVTLVLTDIEGSTALLTRLGRAFDAVLSDHHRLLRGAFSRHGGTEVHTEGDSFLVAFTDAAEALAACAAIQVDLDSHPFPEPVRVRIGVHTGPVRLVADDYTGITVHETARLSAAAHGGQVVVSDSSAAAVGEHLAAGLSLIDLGYHSLRDFDAPRRILQLVGPGLRVAFPALRTERRSHRALPLPPTALVGRDVAPLVDMVVGETRLVTLTGPGGVGKTRLALEVAWHVVERFRGGVWFVDLSDVDDPDAIVERIADTVDPTTSRRPEPATRIARQIGDRRGLLVLDCLDRVVSGAAAIADLLSTIPTLSVVATSRERLRLRAEVVSAVPPLALPTTEAFLDDARRVPAVDLLCRRLEAVSPSTSLGDLDVPVLMRMTRALGGMPLAIELAAAAAAERDLVEVADGLESSLGMLTDGDVDLPERQRSMRAAIAWSVDALPHDDRVALARLSVVDGDIALDGAVAVCDLAHAEVVVDRLAERRLLERSHQGRVSLPDPVREYAAELLSPDDAAATRLAEWCRGMATTAPAKLMGAEAATWLDRLEHEVANIEVAAGRLSPPAALEMVLDLHRLWIARGLQRTGRRLLERLVDAAPAGSTLRGTALRHLAELCRDLGDLDRARRAFTDAADTHRHAGDRVEQGVALVQLAEVERLAGHMSAAGANLDRAATLLADVDDPTPRAQLALNRALLAEYLGAIDAAVGHYDEARAGFRAAGDPLNQAIVELDVSILHLELDELAAAETAAVRAVKMFQATGDAVGIADARVNLGRVRYAAGEVAEADALWHQALATYLEHGRLIGQATVHGNLAHTAAHDHGDRELSRIHLTASAGLWRAVGNAERVVTMTDLLVDLALEDGDLREARRLVDSLSEYADDAGLLRSTLSGLSARVRSAETAR